MLLPELMLFSPKNNNSKRNDRFAETRISESRRKKKVKKHKIDPTELLPWENLGDRLYLYISDVAGLFLVFIRCFYPV